MNTDNLDALSDQALNECFATEVAGWKLLSWKDRKGNPCSGWKSPSGEQCRPIPDFITNANSRADCIAAIRAKRASK